MQLQREVTVFFSGVDKCALGWVSDGGRSLLNKVDDSEHGHGLTSYVCLSAG